MNSVVTACQGFLGTTMRGQSPNLAAPTLKTESMQVSGGLLPSQPTRLHSLP